jgi:hypothetical protein
MDTAPAGMEGGEGARTERDITGFPFAPKALPALLGQGFGIASNAITRRSYR